MPDTNQMYVVIVGIVAITALECVAMYMKTDGQYMSIVVGAISAIVGGFIGIKVSEARAAKTATNA